MWYEQVRIGCSWDISSEVGGINTLSDLTVKQLHYAAWRQFVMLKEEIKSFNYEPAYT